MNERIFTCVIRTGTGCVPCGSSATRAGTAGTGAGFAIVRSMLLDGAAQLARQIGAQVVGFLTKDEIEKLAASQQSAAPETRSGTQGQGFRFRQRVDPRSSVPVGPSLPQQLSAAIPYFESCLFHRFGSIESRDPDQG